VTSLINFAAFQAGWFACVLGAAHATPWLGLPVVAVVAAWHLLRAARPAREAGLLLAAALIGVVWDSAMSATGVLAYDAGVLAPWLAPYWIVALWPLFATTLNVSLRWLRSRAWWPAAFGAVGGPMAYLGGAGLGAVNIPDVTLAVAMLAGGWAVITPVLVALAQRLDGYDYGAQPLLGAANEARA